MLGGLVHQAEEGKQEFNILWAQIQRSNFLSQYMGSLGWLISLSAGT